MSSLFCLSTNHSIRSVNLDCGMDATITPAPHIREPYLRWTNDLNCVRMQLSLLLIALENQPSILMDLFLLMSCSTNTLLVTVRRMVGKTPLTLLP